MAVAKMKDEVLQLIGPSRFGLLNQYDVIGWKFGSPRFGLFGNAIQTNAPLDGVWPRVKRQGNTLRRRYNGKSGWLWWTLYQKVGKLERIERGEDSRFLVVPEKPSIRKRLALWLWRR